MPATLRVHQHRGTLAHTRQALRRGKLTVGFLGGSITDPRPGHNWPEGVCAWLTRTFPKARLVVENAAIGATGSDLAVFRAERDILSRGCDLVFVEYAVNDGGTPTDRRNRTREGLVRKLLADTGRDVVCTYTFCQDMYADMMADRLPPSIAEFEAIAAHYNIGSVWMGLHALNEVRAGQMRWEAWLPDGLHPQHLGSQCYADSVNAFLAQELCGASRRGAKAIPCGARRPAPLFPGNWEHTALLPWDAVSTQGPWRLVRWPHCPWIDQILETAAPGATLAFSFKGRGLMLAFDFGKSAAEFRWRLDGGEWQEEKRERYDWVGEQGWLRPSLLSDALKPGAHRLELEVIHGNATGCRGTNFRLAFAGILS